MTAPLLPRLVALLALLAAACVAPRDDAPPPLAPPPSDHTAGSAAPITPAAGAPPRLNENFLSPDLDVADFVARFEGESREIAVARDALVDALAILPDDRVADVGAGTGLFLAPLSEAVGPRGMVYAVDISPRFLEHLRERVREEGLDNVRVVRGDARSTNLPPDSVDLAFVCDTYHHFEHPQETLASLRRALRPGGRLVVVDFEREPGVSREWLLEHVRAGKEVFTREIVEAGFAPPAELDVPGLDENYVLVFRKAGS